MSGAHGVSPYRVASESERALGAPVYAGRYDSGRRRQSQRTGRERGCWVYVAAEELVRAGMSPDDPPPFYRVWGSSRGGLFVRLYREA